MCNEHTRFDIASLTKPLVVGMLTLRALDSGRLCLWDTLDRFMNVPADKENITLKEILTHTAGFANGIHIWRIGTSPQDCLPILLNTPLQYTPGSRVQYCCGGYILLGQLLAHIYGMPLEEAARREVFEPLRMNHTGYLPQGDNIAATEMQDSGRCLQGEVHDENARFLGGVSGNAGVFSTADDMALFVQMLAAEGKLPNGDRYLSPATVRMAMQNHTPGLEQVRGIGFYLPHYDNGYIGDLFPPETIGHTGFTGTSFSLDPGTGIWLVLLTNRVCPSRDNPEIYRLRRLIHNAVYAAASE